MVLAALLVCVVVIVVLSVRDTPKQPDFLVYDVVGRVKEQDPLSPAAFKLSFNIENNGTANATNVHGSAKFEKDGLWRTAEWLCAEMVLEVGERCPCTAIFWHFSTVPSKKFVITVLCDEGVQREFNVTIPS